ncbi:MAG: valine--tRNA ligase, partial [Deltaproteobacteria bacterium]|nr:valine--tRNA ligase [Deltaproteobacteria bacterium]
GTDHAGIATQIVVERRLDAEGQSRHDFGREKFIEKVWEWKASSGGRIIEQLKGLGCSCDWSRERFTMDKGLSRAVREVFVRLYEEGLIYRGNYIINWCPRCHTALADIEVEHKQTEGRLWYMRYPLAEKSKEITKFITVATTRPETMLGDTAVAVHPEDPRYKDFVGKDLMLPLLNRRIPVVADAAVEPEFGTGAVKVTPAHDLNDFEIAKRHGLQSINIFDENAILTEAAGQYAGLDRYEAREQVIADLKKQGLLEKEEAYKLAVGICYRCKTVVEPRLSKQWFVKVAPLAGPALKAVKDKQTILVPASWERTYDEWMTTIRDWCISRQIWWGHRIPAWTCAACGEVIVAREEPEACPKCGNTDLEQESDVLDTWFSSAIWPFSTLGWPDKTPELEIFYPTSVLITSFDILFFWVARMMMMGLHFMGDVPFKHVYLHALI